MLTEDSCSCLTAVTDKIIGILQLHLFVMAVMLVFCGTVCLPRLCALRQLISCSSEKDVTYHCM